MGTIVLEARPEDVAADGMLLGIVVHLPKQHDAAAADRVPHLDDQLLQWAARARVARDRDRLIAFEHLPDERMRRLLVLPVHVAHRGAVVAGALRSLRICRRGQP